MKFVRPRGPVSSRLQSHRANASNMATRWGIVGAGLIANDFVVALKTLPADYHVVVAVASRSLDRAREFGRKHEIEKAYGSYDELVRDASVQVVYISTIHPSHAGLSQMALSQGKHVLCEKPMTVNSREAEQVVTLAKTSGLFFMEALWTRFFPLYKEIQDTIESSALGEVQVVMVSFGEVGENLERLSSRELCGGVLLDMGIYCLNLIDIVFGGEEPLSITAAGSLTEQGVDRTVGITLLYSNQRSAHATASMGASLPNEAVIVGTRDTLTIGRPFHCPTKFTLASGINRDAPLPSPYKKENFVNSTGMRFEIQAVRQSLLAGECENPCMPHSTSQRIMRWMDVIRQQIGVTYKQDST